MAINILQGIIPINPTSKSSALDDSKFIYLSTILKPIDHYYVPKGDPKLSAKPHKYHPITLGLKETGKSHGNVSYSRIDMDNEIHDPDNYETKHKITIKDHQVFLNDILIGTAPSGKTKAFKERFCKAVIWSLMNDPECLKDKLAEITGSPIMETIQEITTIPAKTHYAKLPVFPIGFLPHLNLTITEERCTA